MTRSFTIRPGDPAEHGATALLRASHALMQSLFPAEDNHYLEISELQAPHIHFFVARNGEEDEDETLGCVALALKDGYAEVKSMFVSPNARGRGVGQALLKRIEVEARAQGQPLIKLETGDALHAAHRLYRAAGFTDCGPFGTYTANASSLFMEKRLDPA